MGNFRSIDINAAANDLVAAKNIIIVPGYGLAIAKAQYAIAEIYSDLTANGVDVKFAIHPV